MRLAHAASLGVARHAVGSDAASIEIAAGLQLLQQEVSVGAIVNKDNRTELIPCAKLLFDDALLLAAARYPCLAT